MHDDPSLDAQGAPSDLALERVVDRLRRRLLPPSSMPLPGARSHRVMAPKPFGKPRSRVAPEGSPLAAVTVLLYAPDDGARATHLLLTRRTDAVRHHRGQICLPGGRLDAAESPQAAAARELVEEVGLAADRVDVLGAMTPVYIPVSGFLVHPFIAWSPGAPEFVRQPSEVRELIEVPLAWLLDGGRVGERREVHDGVPLDIPFYDLSRAEVWGATAMILSEFADLVRGAEARPEGD